MARPRSEAARAKMLEAAAVLVMTEGVNGFSIDEVARRSGVAKTTIYRHFSSANELLIAAFDGAIASFPAPDHGSLREDLIDFVSSILPIFSDAEMRAVTLDLLSATARDPELQQIHRTLVDQRMQPMRSIFDRAKDRGEIDPQLDFETAFDFIEGPFVARWMIRPETFADIDVEAFIDRILLTLKP